MCSVDEAFLPFAEARLVYYLYVDWMVVMCMGYVYVATCTMALCCHYDIIESEFEGSTSMS